jgi:hypothetical protein
MHALRPGVLQGTHSVLGSLSDVARQGSSAIGIWRRAATGITALQERINNSCVMSSTTACVMGFGLPTFAGLRGLRTEVTKLATRSIYAPTAITWHLTIEIMHQEAGSQRMEAGSRLQEVWISGMAVEGPMTVKER